MERKVWARTKGSNLFPNTYIVLVGPPGVGKSTVLSLAESMLRRIPNIFVAPSSLTTAALVDTVVIAKRQVITPGHQEPVMEFNALDIIASELGVFLPAYDPPFMNTLTKLYDGEHYEERRRTGKVNHLIIEKPLLNILGGTTPSYLNSFLPDGAWDQGFTSRTVFVYSSQIIKNDIWADEEAEDHGRQLLEDLVADLKSIVNCHGKITWSSDCMQALTEWDHDDLRPAPEHAKLAHYNSRRLAHTIKLCAVASMARSGGRFVSLSDFETARGWLLEAESSMTEIFDAMAVSLDSRVIDDTWYFVQKVYYRDGKKPVGEHLIFAYLRDRMPSQYIGKTIEIMVRSRDLQMVAINGVACFVPLPRIR
jgi:Ni2+-binding GTPase involved in maturation of urease and hydrogenase